VIDLHTHSILSDGALLPAELARRAYVKGYRVLGISDHVDYSNVDFVVPRLVEACESGTNYDGLEVMPGAEVTHVPPKGITRLVERARELGARFVIVHGETLAEPVAPGTNRAGVEARADILAHPGLISEEDAELAARLGVLLEITAKPGHCLTNGYVAKVAKEVGARLSFGTDSHLPEDLRSRKEAESILLGAGLSEEEVHEVFRNLEELYCTLKTGR